MKFNLSEQEARKEFPTEFDLAKEHFDKKLKGAQLLPGKLKVTLEYAVMIPMMRGMDFIKSISQPPSPKEEEKENQEERFLDHLDKCTTPSLLFVYGRYNKSFQVPKKGLFEQKLREYFIHHDDINIEQRRRAELMSPEEKQKEMEDLLGELSKDGGFFQVNLGPQGAQVLHGKAIVDYAKKNQNK